LVFSKWGFAIIGFAFIGVLVYTMAFAVAFTVALALPFPLYNSKSGKNKPLFSTPFSALGKILLRFYRERERERERKRAFLMF
jgi:hypothetical protein